MSDDLSAVDVVVTVVTVRVDTEGGMLARARRVVLPASMLLNCEHFLSLFLLLFPSKCHQSFFFWRPGLGSLVGDFANFFCLVAVVALAVAVVLLLPKRICLLRG